MLSISLLAQIITEFNLVLLTLGRRRSKMLKAEMSSVNYNNIINFVLFYTILYSFKVILSLGKFLLLKNRD